MTSSAPEELTTSRGVDIAYGAGDVALDWARGASGAPGQASSDASDVVTAIVLQVTAALLAHPPTELTVIEVNNRQGIVTLKGQVSSEQLYTMAGEIASRHPGVDATVNALEIHERVESDH